MQEDDSGIVWLPETSIMTPLSPHLNFAMSKELELASPARG